MKKEEKKKQLHLTSQTKHQSRLGIVGVKMDLHSIRFSSAFVRFFTFLLFLKKVCDFSSGFFIYAHVRFRNGHETKLSFRDVAPLADRDSLIDESNYVFGDFDENESSSEDKVAPDSPNAQSTSESLTTSTLHEDQVQGGSLRLSLDT